VTSEQTKIKKSGENKQRMLHIQEVGILVMAKNLELNLYNLETNKTDIDCPLMLLVDVHTAGLTGFHRLLIQKKYSFLTH
jgi:hypothetical protein